MMSPPREKIPRWYLAYFFLAAFDILTVSVGLYLNHQIMKLYTASVDVNREWAARLGQLAELRGLAGEVNAPGNDVFDTRDVGGESAELSAKHRQFKEKLAAIRSVLHVYVSQSEREPLLHGLTVVDAAVEEMSNEALQIFSHLAQKRPEEAATRMAAMDRKYALVHAAFAGLAELIRTSQQARFDQQRATAASMQRFEYLIATFIVVMVVGASVYGHRVYRQIRTDTREKEHFLHELQQKEERYRLLVEGVKDHANVMLDSLGHVVSWNTGAERLYGYQGQEILRRHCSLLYSAEDVEKGTVAQLVRRVEATGTSEGEGWHLRKDGSQFWGEDVMTALYEEGGRLRGFSKVTRDITERKAAAERLRLEGAALESAANAVVITDRDGSITWVNPAFTRLTGYAADEARGRNVRILKSGQQDQVFYQELWKTIRAGNVWHGEIVNRRKDGSLYTEEQTITPVRDASGEISHFIGIKQDIGERKQAQAELQRANTRLQELDRLRAQFFADISHELRTPLTVMRGEAEVTLRGKNKPVREYKTTLNRIVELTNQVNKQVKDLLFLARSESGMLQIETQQVSLQDVITESLQEARILARSKRITVGFTGQEKPLTLQGDAQRLKQLVMILLDNAVKYTEPGGYSQVSLGTDGSWAKIAISDNGVGIPRDDLSRVFERFHRVKRPDSGTPGGAGLGLPIARWITQAHRGTILLESTPGKGTTATILLPIRETGKI